MIGNSVMNWSLHIGTYFSHYLRDNPTDLISTIVMVYSSDISVSLTHVGIRQILTCDCRHGKVRLLYHFGTFLPTWFFLPLQKFKTIKTKMGKNPYTQANMCLLHISRNFKDIYKYIMLYSLSLANCKQLRKYYRFYRSSLSAGFFFFFSIDFRSNQFRVDWII